MFNLFLTNGNNTINVKNNNIEINYDYLNYITYDIRKQTCVIDMINYNYNNSIYPYYDVGIDLLTLYYLVNYNLKIDYIGCLVVFCNKEKNYILRYNLIEDNYINLQFKKDILKQQKLSDNIKPMFLYYAPSKTLICAKIRFSSKTNFNKNKNKTEYELNSVLFKNHTFYNKEIW